MTRTGLLNPFACTNIFRNTAALYFRAPALALCGNFCSCSGHISRVRSHICQTHSRSLLLLLNRLQMDSLEIWRIPWLCGSTTGLQYPQLQYAKLIQPRIFKIQGLLYLFFCQWRLYLVYTACATVWCITYVYQDNLFTRIDSESSRCLGSLSRSPAESVFSFLFTMSDIDEKQRISDDVKQEYVDLVDLAPQRRGWTHWLTTWGVEMRGEPYYSFLWRVIILRSFQGIQPVPIEERTDTEYGKICYVFLSSNMNILAWVSNSGRVLCFTGPICL